MPSAGAIRAGKAFVELSADDTLVAVGLKRAQNSLKAFGSSVQAIGSSFLKVGGTAALPFAGSVKVFADFESNMARVRALTNASDGDFKMLGDQAKKLGRDTVFSSAQAAQAMGVFAQAGFKVNEIMAATGPTLDLAATAQIEIADAADIAVTVMSGMGIGVGQLTGVVDLLAKASVTANTNITMLGEAFKYVGPIAKTAGISLEEITAAIQLLSKAGIKGETAGAMLRGMILSLATPTAEASSMMNALGIRVKDGQGKFLSLTAIMSQFQAKLGGLEGGDKLEVLGTIFPDRQAAGGAELIAQGADKLAASTKALGDRTGFASRIATTQLDTLKGAAEQLMSSIETVGIELGGALAPTLRSIGSFLVEVTNGMTAFVANNRELFVTIAKGVVAAIAFGGAMVALGFAIKALAVGIGILRAAIVITTTVIYTINAVLRLFTVTVNVARVATMAFASLTAVMAAISSPVGLIIIALAGLTAWLIKSGNAAKILESLGAAFQSLKATAIEAFGGIAAALKAGDLGLAARILWAGLKVEFLKGIAFLKGIWANWGTSAMNVFTNVKFMIAGWIVDIQASFGIGWIEITGALYDAFVGVIGTIKIAWSAFTGFLYDKFDDTFASVMSTLIGVGAEIKRQVAIAKGAATLSSSSHAIAMINKQEEKDLAENSEKREKSKTDRAKAHEKLVAAPGQEIAANQKTRQKEQADIEATRTGAHGILKSDKEREISDRKAHAMAVVEESKKAVEDARAELSGLISKAETPKPKRSTLVAEAFGSDETAKVMGTGRYAKHKRRGHQITGEAEKEPEQPQKKAPSIVTDEEAKKRVFEAFGSDETAIVMGTGENKKRRRLGREMTEPGMEGMTPGGLDFAMDQTKADVKASFSAAALQGQGAGETIAGEQLKTSKHTNEILEGVRKDVQRNKQSYT